MPDIIRDGEIVHDDWTHLADGDALPSGNERVTLSLSRYLEHRDALRSRPATGVRLGPSDDPEAIAGLLPDLALVVLEVPTFRDGRHFSTARLLRGRHAYTGELRARGDVLPDQMFYMHRCGINSFEVRADKRLDTALRCLRSFSVTYQGAEDQALPLYRRRA